MDADIERLLSEYDGGQISRRTFVASLTALLVTRQGVEAQPGAPPPIAVEHINHVSLRVSDVKRSTEWYQRVFGLPVQTYQGNVPVLRIGSGPQFVALAGVT